MSFIKNDKIAIYLMNFLLRDEHIKEQDELILKECLELIYNERNLYLQYFLE